MNLTPLIPFKYLYKGFKINNYFYNKIKRAFLTKDFLPGW